MKVLVAENEKQTRSLLSEILRKEGFDVIEAEDGDQAFILYSKETPDFVCLDILMPGLSGIDVCKKIRETNQDVPIIFITAKTDTIDKIVGLEIGGDDYIIKPFDINEVVTRIRTVARRCLGKVSEGVVASEDDPNADFQIHDLCVMPKKLQAEKGGEVINLSLRDIKILKLLADNIDAVVHRDTLLDVAWGEHIMPESRTVDWHISQLRKKVESDPKNPVIIQTVHGVGYKYEQVE